MPTINKAVVVPASGIVDNAISGSQYEYLPFPAVVELGMTTTATGVLTTVYSGTDILAEEGAVSVGSANVYPKYPDEFYYRDEAAPGDRLRIFLRNTTAGALTVMLSLQITPLG